jgi:hypothetical protein
MVAMTAANRFAGKTRIKATIEPGVFTTERSVSFMAGERRYALFAGESTVDEGEGTMLVTVIAADGVQVLVDLPGEAIQGGRRVQIPREMVIDYPQSANDVARRVTAAAAPAGVEGDPPPTVEVVLSPPPGSVAPPSGPADEKGVDAATRALLAALATAEPEQPPSERPSEGRFLRGIRSILRGIRTILRWRLPDLRAHRTLPSTAEPPAPSPVGSPRLGWNLACEERLDALLREAEDRGDDIMHCLAPGGACRGIVRCLCTCPPCSLRRALEEQAHGERKGQPRP